MFIIRGAPWLHKLNCVFYEGLVLGMPVLAIISFVKMGQSKCSKTGYGSAVALMAVINLIVGLLILLSHIGLLIQY